MLEIHAIRREDLLTAFSLSADLLLRSRLYALAERKVLRKRNTIGGAVNRRSPKMLAASLNAFFCASPIYGSAEDFTFLLDVTVSREVTPAAKQQIGETRKKR